MDTNFRLRSKIQSINSQDPTLGPGWSYFVNHSPYADFIKDYMDEDEVGGLLPCLLCSIGLQFTDQHMCWVSSTAQYAHEEVEGS